jgi:5'-nucleotidase (lipoprotein e(P4) family)
MSVRAAGTPPELHWFRNSAERRAVYYEVYGFATERVKMQSSSLKPQSWAVVLDVDETILDNSEYQARLATSGQAYATNTWEAWVHDQRAVALPGAVDFLHMVRVQGGRIVLITNRNLDDCPDTEANLHQQGLEYDAILRAPKGPDGKWVSDKNPRFEQVNSQVLPGIGRVQVVAYVGDNIQDFPGLSQGKPGEARRFGYDYFVLPNPMYGSFMNNVYR